MGVELKWRGGGGGRGKKTRGLHYLLSPHCILAINILSKRLPRINDDYHGSRKYVKPAAHKKMHLQYRVFDQVTTTSQPCYNKCMDTRKDNFHLDIGEY